MSTAFHPQTDGQSEAVNKTIAMYLCCITGDRPRAWLDWLPWAEYVYNTAYHSALRTTPFHVVYDRYPPPMLSVLHWQEQQQLTLYSKSVTPSSLMFGSVSFKLRNMPNATMMPITGHWRSMLMTGYGFGS